jgi:hypothetical protein
VLFIGLSAGRWQALRKREAVWTRLVDSGQTAVTAVLTVRTSLADAVNVTVSASLFKPSVVETDTLEFPLVQVCFPPFCLSPPLHLISSV